MTGRSLPRTMFFWMLGLMIGAIGAGLAIRQYHLGWPGALAALVVLGVAAVLLIRLAEKRSNDLGCSSPALNRYNRRIVTWSIIYMAGFFSATMAYRRFGVEGAALWVVAMLPSIGILGMIWAMARLLIEETDEYLRLRFAQQALFATGVVLVLTTIWGFFEQFMLVPHVPSWVVLPLFAVAMGLGASVRWVRG